MCKVRVSLTYLVVTSHIGAVRQSRGVATVSNRKPALAAVVRVPLSSGLLSQGSVLGDAVPRPAPLILRYCPTTL